MNRVVPLRAILPWPLPAVLAWALAWAVFATARGLGIQGAALVGASLGLALAWMWPGSGWRRALIGGGFPLSLLLGSAAGTLPALLWLLPVAVLLWIYPLQAWRDAPLFPTPSNALLGLAEATGMPEGARILDAGCGLGDGLLALRAAFAQAHVEGVERSRPLAWLARRRCRFAQVRQGDMWVQPWDGLDMVYLFQRPESMARAWAKAEAEMNPGAWLVSLEFAVPGRAPDATLATPQGKPLWLYRVGAARRAQSTCVPADNFTRAPDGLLCRH